MPRETQPSARFVGLLFIAVLLLAGVGLFSASYMQSESEKALDQAVQSAELLDDARSAQVNFKIQVQHWKNFLLRGHNAEDYESYINRFRQQADLVQEDLSAVLAFPTFDPGLHDEIAAILEEHARLGELYSDAMERFDPDNPASGFAVDRSVRGIDQDLTQRIDTAADQILAVEQARVAKITSALDEHFERARLFTSLATGLVLLMVILLVWRLRQRGRT